MIIQAIFLGLVQGLTEFIPISSSGHLIIINELFGWDVGNFRFDVLTNVGTLMALTLYFWKDLIGLARGAIENDTNQRKLAVNIVIATIPSVVAGIFLQELVEETFRSIFVAATTLFLVGVLMLIVDSRVGKKEAADVSSGNALTIGLAQVLAFVPGTSRSGITIIAGLTQRLSRQAAARFSFLMALPVLGGGVLKVALEPETWDYMAENPAVVLAGVAASFVSGYAAVTFLMRFLGSHSLAVFAWYRIGLAVAIVAVGVLG